MGAKFTKAYASEGIFPSLGLQENEVSQLRVSKKDRAISAPRSLTTTENNNSTTTQQGRQYQPPFPMPSCGGNAHQTSDNGGG